MKKKLFAFFGVCAIASIGIAVGCSRAVVPVCADEGAPVVEAACTVTVPTIEHVTVTSSINAGNVGDEVTIKISTDKLYLLDYQPLVIKVNGNVVDKNTYKFNLVAGVNAITLENVVVTPLFSEPLQSIAVSILNGNFTWAMLLNPSTIIALITFITSGGCGVALVKVYSKYKKEKSITRETIVAELEKLIPGVCEKTLGGLVKDVISPLIAKVGNVEEAMTIFSRCFAIIQENTPESKLAILDELSKIKITDNDVIDKVEAKIKEALAEAEKKYLEQMELLSKMKVSNADAIAESANNIVGEVEEIVEKIKDDGTSI